MLGCLHLWRQWAVSLGTVTVAQSLLQQQVLEQHRLIRFLLAPKQLRAGTVATAVAIGCAPENVTLT
jgi:ATP phosphoribosyltransferase regulatory subunit HisZ